MLENWRADKSNPNMENLIKKSSKITKNASKKLKKNKPSSPHLISTHAYQQYLSFPSPHNQPTKINDGYSHLLQPLTLALTHIHA